MENLENLKAAPEIMKFHNFDGSITEIKKGHSMIIDTYSKNSGPGVFKDADELNSVLTCRVFNNWLIDVGEFANICNIDIGIDADVLKKLDLYEYAYKDWQSIVKDVVTTGYSNAVIMGNTEDYLLDIPYYSPSETVSLWLNNECSDPILKIIANFGLSVEKTDLLYSTWQSVYSSVMDKTDGDKLAASAAAWNTLHMVKKRI